MKTYKYLRNLLIILSVLALGLLLADNAKYTLYINSHIYFQAIICKLLFVILVLGIGLMIYRKRHAAMICITALFGAAVLFAMTLDYARDRSYGAVMTELRSPDGEHQIAIYEWHGTLTGNAIIYEKISPFFMREVDSYRTDFLKPAANGDYTITWNEEGFTYDYLVSRREQQSGFWQSITKKYMK